MYRLGPGVVALGVSKHRQVIERASNTGLIAELPAYCQALLIKRLRGQEVTAGTCQVARSVQSIGAHIRRYFITQFKPLCKPPSSFGQVAMSEPEPPQSTTETQRSFGV